MFFFGGDDGGGGGGRRCVAAGFYLFALNTLPKRAMIVCDLRSNLPLLTPDRMKKREKQKQNQAIISHFAWLSARTYGFFLRARVRHSQSV